MNLVDRVKNLLITPKVEWLVIKSENASVQKMLTTYVIPLSLIPAVSALLSGLIWHSIGLGLANALAAIVMAIIGFYAGTYIADALAPSFSSEKDLDRSAQLVGYSYTPNAIASILGIIPILNFLAVIAGFGYMIYLMYLGVAPLKNTPDEKRVGYVVVILLVQLILFFTLSAIFTSILFRNYFIY
jgi:ABC-type multidrug transport system permease subunit